MGVVIGSVVLVRRPFDYRFTLWLSVLEWDIDYPERFGYRAAQGDVASLKMAHLQGR
jgi:hypothetical protein